MNFDDEVLEAIRKDGQLKYSKSKEKTKHISGLNCPGCNRPTAFISIDQPHRLSCSHTGSSCGWYETTRSRYRELWENLEDKHPATVEDPKATAKAYMSMRGFDLIKTEQWFEQGSVLLDDGSLGVTVRFMLWDGFWWDRLINERDFVKHTKKKGKPLRHSFKGEIQYTGKHWAPPGMQINDGDHVYIVEGIFHAIAFYLAGYKAIAAFSTSSLPSDFIKANLKRNITWCLAYDAGDAGENAALKYLKVVNDLGEASRVSNPHSKDMDWDDLYRAGMLNDDYLKDCKWRGRVLSATSIEEKAFAYYCWKEYQYKIISFNKNTYTCGVNQKELDEKIGDRKINFYEDSKTFTNQVMIKPIINGELQYNHAESDKYTNERKYIFTAYTKEFPKGNHLEFSANALNQPERFTVSLSNQMTWLEFTGSRGDLTMLRKMWRINNTATVEALQFIGYDENSRAYVFPEAGYKDGKCVKANKHGYIDFKSCQLKTSLVGVKFIHSEKFDKNILPDFIKVFDLNGLCALAYVTAALFIRQIKEEHQQFPFLELTGEAQAGKSTLIRFIWKLLGRENYEGIDILKTSESSRGRALSQLSNLPIVLVESDREAMPNNNKGGRPSKSVDWDDFKPIFDIDGILMSRGVKTNDNQTQDSIFRGALVITQNASVQGSEPIMTRITHLHCTTAHKKIENREIADRLKTMPVKELAGYLHLALTHEKEYLAKFFSAFDYHRQILTKSTGIKNQRVIDCHAQLMAAVDALTVLFENLHKPVIDQALAHVVGRAKDRERRLNAEHPLVQQFWENYHHLNDQVMTLIDQDHNETEVPNQKLNHSLNKQLIAINLNEYYEHCRKRGQETPSITDLKEVLKTSSFYKFVADKHVASRITKSKKRCWVFEKPAEMLSN